MSELKYPANSPCPTPTTPSSSEIRKLELYSLESLPYCEVFKAFILASLQFESKEEFGPSCAHILEYLLANLSRFFPNEYIRIALFQNYLFSNTASLSVVVS